MTGAIFPFFLCVLYQIKNFFLPNKRVYQLSKFSILLRILLFLSRSIFVIKNRDFSLFLLFYYQEFLLDDAESFNTGIVLIINVVSSSLKSMQLCKQYNDDVEQITCITCVESNDLQPKQRKKNSTVKFKKTNAFTSVITCVSLLFLLKKTKL